MEELNQELLTYWGKKVVELAGESALAGGGPFAAVILNRSGELIASGTNRVTQNFDPTAHAEVNAIRQACAHSSHFELEGCFLITSCEPCPMCLGAIYWSRLSRVYYLAGREDAAQAGFDDAFIYDQIQTPPSQRSIPFTKVELPEALDPFIAWSNNPGKIEY